MSDLASIMRCQHLELEWGKSVTAPGSGADGIQATISPALSEEEQVLLNKSANTLKEAANGLQY